ncbi:hypothetical protein [Helicobacter sp. 23-1045]
MRDSAIYENVARFCDFTESNEIISSLRVLTIARRSNPHYFFITDSAFFKFAIPPQTPQNLPQKSYFFPSAKALKRHSLLIYPAMC